MRYMNTRVFGTVLLFILAITSIVEITKSYPYRSYVYRPYDETFTIPGNLAVGGTSLFTGQITTTGGDNVSGTGSTLKSGTGTPEGAQTAPVGSLWMRTNGASGSSLYVKESGAGNTGWTAMVSGSTVSGANPGFYMAPGDNGACNFDGVTGTVCGATLSGSTYDAGRDFSGSSITVAVGVRVKTRNYRGYSQGACTINGTMDVTGGNASGGSGGLKQDVNNTCGAGTNGGAANGAGINASSYIPYGLFPQNTATTTASGANGLNGPSFGRGAGGGGVNTPAVGGPGAGGASGTMNGGGTFMVDSQGLFGCRAPDGQTWSGGTGGGGGGQSIQAGSACTAGGGGAGGGWLPLTCGSLGGTGTIAANGGNGANGSGLSGTNASCGGGGGGGGGEVSIRFGSYSGSVTVQANGGTGGTGVAVGAGATGFSGGTGAAGVITCVNTSGAAAKPTGCP